MPETQQSKNKIACRPPPFLLKAVQFLQRDCSQSTQKITRQGMSFYRLYRPISGNPDSGIPEFFAVVIRNTAQRFRIPTNDRNLESKFHWQRLESSTCNPESTAWNLESKTVLDSLAWGDLYILPYRRSVRPHSTAAHRIDVAAEKVGRTLIDISTNSI